MGAWGFLLYELLGRVWAAAMIAIWSDNCLNISFISSEDSAFATAAMGMLLLRSMNVCKFCCSLIAIFIDSLNVVGSLLLMLRASSASSPLIKMAFSCMSACAETEALEEPIALMYSFFDSLGEIRN